MLVLAGKVYSCLKLKTRFLLLLQNQNLTELYVFGVIGLLLHL